MADAISGASTANEESRGDVFEILSEAARKLVANQKDHIAMEEDFTEFNRVLMTVKKILTDRDEALMAGKKKWEQVLKVREEIINARREDVNAMEKAVEEREDAVESKEGVIEAMEGVITAKEGVITAIEEVLNAREKDVEIKERAAAAKMARNLDPMARREALRAAKHNRARFSMRTRGFRPSGCQPRESRTTT